MSIHINLSTEMEGYIKGKVSSGQYGNATEVIRVPSAACKQKKNG